MADKFSEYQMKTEQINSGITRKDPELAQCLDYKQTSFLGSSNSCVCSEMGETEAAITMRDGLHQEFMREGRDDLWAHIKQIGKTWNMKGGGLPLVTLIIENGMKCPGVLNDALSAESQALQSPWVSF